MTLVSRSVEMLLDRDPEAARTQLTQLRELQREALAEMRALIFELRPGNLEQDGLVRALKTHTAALQGRIGLPVVVESDARRAAAARRSRRRSTGSPRRRSTTSSSTPAPTQVRLEIRRTPSGVRLRISDDGKGFDPRQVPDGHLGLAGMQARAARIGGDVQLPERDREGDDHRGRRAEDPANAGRRTRASGEMPSGVDPRPMT